MKFSAFTSTILGVTLIFASKVAASDVGYFTFPEPNVVFCRGKSIEFVVDDMPDGGDGDGRVYADLYTEYGRYVKTIRSWWGDDIDDNNKFAFSWTIDPDMKCGRYFIEMYSDDDDDDGDVSRSFMFEVIETKKSAPYSGTAAKKPANKSLRKSARGRRSVM